MANDYPNFLSLDFPRTLIIYGQCSNPVTTFENISIPPGDNAFELSSNYAVLHPSSRQMLHAPSRASASTARRASPRAAPSARSLRREAPAACASASRYTAASTTPANHRLCPLTARWPSAIASR